MQGQLHAEQEVYHCDLDDEETMDDEEYTVILVPGIDWGLISDGDLVVCRTQARLESGVEVIEGMEAEADMLGGSG